MSDTVCELTAVTEKLQLSRTASREVGSLQNFRAVCPFKISLWRQISRSERAPSLMCPCVAHRDSSSHLRQQSECQPVLGMMQKRASTGKHLERRVGTFHMPHLSAGLNDAAKSPPKICTHLCRGNVVQHDHTLHYYPLLLHWSTLHVNSHTTKPVAYKCKLSFHEPDCPDAADHIPQLLLTNAFSLTTFSLSGLLIKIITALHMVRSFHTLLTVKTPQIAHFILRRDQPSVSFSQEVCRPPTWKAGKAYKVSSKKSSFFFLQRRFIRLTFIRSAYHNKNP